MSQFEGDIESLPVPSGRPITGDVPNISLLSPSSWLVFLQAMFDVSTADVAQRLFIAATPYQLLKSEGNILLYRPDLYGPFWIATTAIIAMTGAANIERLFTEGYASTDFSLLLTAAWFMYGCLAAVPLVAFGFAWIAKRQDSNVSTQESLTYAHLVCMYGYSNLALIPVSILCVVPISIVQNISLIVGAANSGVFIFANLWKQMPVSQLRMVTVGAALICQAATYLAFYLVFLARS